MRFFNLRLGDADRASVGKLVEAARASGRPETTASACVRAAVRFAADHPEVVLALLVTTPRG